MAQRAHRLAETFQSFVSSQKYQGNCYRFGYFRYDAYRLVGHIFMDANVDTKPFNYRCSQGTRIKHDVFRYGRFNRWFFFRLAGKPGGTEKIPDYEFRGLLHIIV